MRRRVVVTGMGWITPLGKTLEEVWRRLLAGESGIAETTNFDARTFPTNFAAEVKDFDLAAYLGNKIEQHKHSSLNTRFALAAAKTAWEHAGFNGASSKLDRSMVGIYLGGGEGPIDFDAFAEAAVTGWNAERRELDAVQWAETAYRVLDADKEFAQDPNMACGHVAMLLGIEGPSFNTLTACAASTQAIGEATSLIRRGDADVMVTGGCHSMIHPLGITGFNRLTALSTRNDTCLTASRPFDRTRDGFVIGEGAGMLILEELEHARARGATLHAEVRGYGSTADAFRITDIHQEGRGGVAAMRQALDDAGLRPEDIDYISAHGTGTEENDKIETKAIRAVFGERARKVPISSIKSMLGHLIAAAGAVELISCVLSIRDGILPPTTNYEHPDPNCDLDYVPNEARKATVRNALSNSFGFGGQNDTLVISASPTD